MKYQKTLMTGLMCVLLLCGCEEQQVDPNAVDTSQVNRGIVDTYSDLAIQNAIISQHTLYPYHFVKNSAQMNALGERDLSVLIQHFQENPGQITLYQGNTESLLYQSRAQTVSEKLLQGGIPDEQIRFVSGMPGGDGIASNTVIEILDAETRGSTGSMEMDTSF
jgi:hypothetical protein